MITKIESATPDELLITFGLGLREENTWRIYGLRHNSTCDEIKLNNEFDLEDCTIDIRNMPRNFWLKNIILEENNVPNDLSELPHQKLDVSDFDNKPEYYGWRKNGI